MITNQNQIDEEDLEFLFSGKKRKKKSKAKTAIKYSALFLLIAFFVFFLINYQALTKELSFWYHNDFKNDTLVTDQKTNTSTTPTFISKTNSIDIPLISDNHIVIPAISVDAPVTWLVKNTPDETSSSLQNGVIQLLGTATPGTVGNVFVTGHSSNYAWAPGRYKSVFALLGKVSVGDIVYLKYQNNTFAYKVYEQDIIKPNDTSVLEQGQKSILTLMTCTPVGTSLNRLIVKANQIFPDPKFNTSSNSSQNTGSLPGVR